MAFRLDPYLAFHGNCAEAMRFYERTLGGQLDLMTFGNSPACGDMPPESHHLVMHACLTQGEFHLMASDTPPGMPYEGMKGLSVAISFDSNEEARRVFDAFSEGGQVQMPFGPTFWAEAFGMVTDRFGTPWLVNGKAVPLNFG